MPYAKDDQVLKKNFIMETSNLSVTPWEIIISISIIFGFLFSINLFRQLKGNKRANRFLALFLFTLTVLLFSNFVVITHIYKSCPQLIGTSFLIWYILPPSFYFYVKTGIKADYKFAWYDLLHLLPFVFMLFKVAPFFLLPAESKLQWFEHYLITPKSLSLNAVFIVVYSFTYLAACMYLIFNFEKNYKKGFANTSIEHIDGIKRLVLVYAIYQVLDLIGMSASFFSNQTAIGIMQFISVSLSIFIFVVSYTYLRQPEKFFQSKAVKAKYKTSKLSASDLSIYSEKLEHEMLEEKLYLDSEINLSGLAQKLNISPHTLSQVINQYYQMNFYEFINRYRVEEVKNQLMKAENKNMTIIAIAYDAGFNSKSSFHRIWKKFVGKSPTQFLKEKNTDKSQG